MKKPQKYFVLGGKWWDRVNGNTYTKAKICDTNGVIFYSEFCYGYGSYYMTLAKEEVQKRTKNKNFILYDMGSFYDKKSIVKNGQF